MSEATTGNTWTSREWIHPTTRGQEAKGGSATRPAGEPRRLRAAPDRDPIAILAAAGSGSPPGPPAAAPRADGRVAVRLLPRHARGHGLRPRRRTPAPTSWSRPAATPTSPTSGCSPRPSGRSCSMPTTSTRRCPGRGSGTSSGSRRASSSPAAQRLQRRAESREATIGAVRGYREWMARYAGDAPDRRLVRLDHGRRHPRGAEAPGVAGARRDSPPGASRRSSQGPRRDGMRGVRVADRPSSTVDASSSRTRRSSRTSSPDVADGLEKVFTRLPRDAAGEPARLPGALPFVDFALKVVGVGSVGTRCFVVVLQGRDENDPLHPPGEGGDRVGPGAVPRASRHANHGERVVVGQQLMQATPRHLPRLDARPGRPRLLLPPALGHEGLGGHALLEPPGSASTAACAVEALARAHARTGDAVAISAYLGTSDTFDGAIADFAETYADVNERDHAAYVAEIAAGRLSTTTVSA